MEAWLALNEGKAGCEIKEGMLMKITKVRLGRISVPLRVPFKTALRQVNSVEDIIVEIHTDSGEVGFGEAPPTGVITGDTTGAIIGASRTISARPWWAGMWTISRTSPGQSRTAS